MSKINNPQSNQPQQMIYQIRIEGHLSPLWEIEFEGFRITLDDSGETVLTGPVVDQAALHGLLKKIRDLGLPLVSAARLQSDHIDESE